MIHKVAKMTINSVRNNTNQANASGVQVQFADNPAGKTHQNLLISRMIGIWHEEILVLAPLMEPCIGMKNQPVLTIIIGVVQATNAQTLPMMKEAIAITTVYNAGEIRTPRRISRTVVYGSNPYTSTARAFDGSVISDIYPNPPPCTPPYILWYRSIGNIRQTTTPKRKKTK